MANLTIGGLRYIGNIFGGADTPFTLEREIASGYATALNTGDPIKQVSDGTVALCAATDTPVGVAIGFSYVINGARESRPLVPASTTFSPTAVGSVNASKCTFVPAWPGILFEADADDGAAANDTLAEFIGLLGANATLTSGTGDTTTGVSAYSLDISTANTTNTLTWRIVDLVKRADNDPTVTRFKVIITPNLSEWTSTTGI